MDARDRAALGWAPLPDHQAQAILYIPNEGTFVTHIPAPTAHHGAIKVNAAANAQEQDAGETHSHSTRIILRGTLQPAVHRAHLAILINPPLRHLTLSTQTPRPRQAKATARSLINVIAANNLTGIVAAFAPSIAGSNKAEIQRQFASEGIHITRLTQTGPGRLGWLPSGYPAWRVPVVATATTPNGVRTKRTTLTLIEEQSRWWLFSA